MKRLSLGVRQRLKLVALIVLFAGPLVTAWAMVEWRVGIPDERVAHGRLMPSVPRLAEWPVEPLSPALDPNDWVLAYDCVGECNETADRWWRVHRALGREAAHVTRLRLGGQDAPLPGEQTGHWRERPDWRNDASVWVIDPEGHVVLSYRQDHDAEEVLEDIRHLLRMNPQPAQASRE